MLKNVMLIDDNDIDLFVNTQLLKRAGLTENVIAQKSAYSALSFLRKNQNNPDTLPKSIFLDIRMPEIDGFGFLDEFEKLSKDVKETCKIYMLSSSLDTKDIERAKSNPYVSKLLNKPLNVKEI